jgi:hypothetical protein
MAKRVTGNTRDFLRAISIAVFFICFSGTAVIAQPYTATAKLDSAKIPLGGQANLQLRVFIPVDALNDKNKFIQWHSFTDTINKSIEIVEASDIDTSYSADKKTAFLNQRITITSFDTGYMVIPPFRFLRDGDSTKFFETQAMLLEVTSVPVDTAQAIMDIKAPIEVPYTFREALPYIIGFLALAGIIFLLFRYFRKRKDQPEEIIIRAPEIPPHVAALNKLDELYKQKLWQEGKSKQYHSLLTEIIRIYLEERYRIKALEQTSDEIILSCRTLPIHPDSKLKLQQLLSLADFVKFAKMNPLPQENELSYNHAVEFIKATIPQEEPVIVEDKNSLNGSSTIVNKPEEDKNA